MPCRVGITTDPIERRRHWEGEYRSFRQWRVAGRYSSKAAAQAAETLFAGEWGCDAHAGGGGPEYAVWYVYVFQHDGY